MMGVFLECLRVSVYKVGSFLPQTGYLPPNRGYLLLWMGYLPPPRLRHRRPKPGYLLPLAVYLRPERPQLRGNQTAQ